MTRRLLGSSGDLPAMFLLVLFGYLSVILKCLCLVSLNCVLACVRGNWAYIVQQVRRLQILCLFFFSGGAGVGDGG